VSLSGSVEDLPLLEILQVVAFCQKTGHLTVRTPRGDAGVAFDSGRVVAGYVWDVPSLPPDPPDPGPQHDAQVRRRITAVLERLVRLQEGAFAFTLTDTVPRSLGDRDLSGETLSGGINPEELMLDLARQLDEDRRNASAALEASLSAPGAEELPLEELLLDEVTPPSAEEANGPAVLLVDDEPEVLRVVGHRLREAGFALSQARDPAAARREMDRLAASLGRFLLVVDLGLPTETGTTFRGGLDVARAASGLASPPPVLLMADRLDEKLRARARRLGVSLLAFKPNLSKLDPRQYEVDLRAFGDKIAKDLLPRLAGRQRPRVGRPAAAELPVAVGRDAAAVLRAALEELDQGPDPDLVAFLILKTARALFPRGILFGVKDDQLRGLSGFGAADDGDSLDLLARELVVPLDQSSPFAEAVARGVPWAGPLPGNGVMTTLLDRIGRLRAARASIIPVRAQRETIAVLYGDAPAAEAPPPLDALVGFVERAGRALEGSLRSAPPAPSAP
jgi:CheY-like chemotaxis protein